ncbi:MAG: GNAT family N-acetyltransferase [Caldilineaceae bacterium]
MEMFDSNDCSLMIQPEEEALQRRCIAAIIQGVDEFEQANGQDDNNRPLILAVLHRDGEVVAGLLGKLLRGWLQVDMLWVAESLRGRGYGAGLMQRAEAIAIDEGCRSVHLETYSFQAPDFYKKLGYEVFGALEEYPPGETKYYFRKQLG